MAPKFDHHHSSKPYYQPQLVCHSLLMTSCYILNIWVKSLWFGDPITLKNTARLHFCSSSSRSFELQHKRELSVLFNFDMVFWGMTRFLKTANFFFNYMMLLNSIFYEINHDCGEFSCLLPAASFNTIHQKIFKWHKFR